MTREVVDKFHPMCIPVEAELGHVGAETDYEEALNHYMYTDPSQAAEFVEKTDIDSLAVAIGNQHGAYTAPPQILRFWRRSAGTYPSRWCSTAHPA